MLTLNTQIPTVARGAVRSIVKGHTDWPNFLIEKGLISASARNADLIEFALRHKDVTAKIEALLMLSPVGAQADAPDTMMEDETMPDETAAASPVSIDGFQLDSVLASVDQFWPRLCEVN